MWNGPVEDIWYDIDGEEVIQYDYADYECWAEDSLDEDGYIQGFTFVIQGLPEDIRDELDFYDYYLDPSYYTPWSLIYREGDEIPADEEEYYYEGEKDEYYESVEDEQELEEEDVDDGGRLLMHVDKPELNGGIFSIFLADVAVICLSFIACYVKSRFRQEESHTQYRSSQLPKAEDSSIFDDASKHRPAPPVKVDADDESNNSGATSANPFVVQSSPESYKQIVCKNTKTLGIMRGGEN